MEKIYIRNHDSYGMVLEYETEKGPLEEVASFNLPIGVKFNRGFYVKINGNFVGVFSSKKGPVLFLNKDEFSLTDEEYTGEIQKKENVNVFSLKHGDQVCFRVEYPPITYLNYGAWSDEEFLDFFSWLVNELNNHRKDFVKYRTMDCGGQGD